MKWFVIEHGKSYDEFMDYFFFDGDDPTTVHIYLLDETEITEKHHFHEEEGIEHETMHWKLSGYNKHLFPLETKTLRHTYYTAVRIE